MRGPYAAAGALLAIIASGPALADKIRNPMAVFAGLDKITGRIISFEVKTDETVQFGSLQITPRACYTRPPTEAPQTDGFVDVDEVDTNNQYKRIFSGWMYAASPGLNGVEHPVYDVWLTNCKGGTEIIAATPDVASIGDPAGRTGAATPAGAAANGAAPGAPPKPGTVPRVRTPRAPTDTVGIPPPSPPAQVNGTLFGQVYAPPPPLARDPTGLGAPIPPANIPAPRRAPTQRFFPAQSEAQPAPR